MSVASLSNYAHPLYVESVGEGEDVILLHGWGMHGAYWQSLIDGLQDKYRVHSIDLPGHGKSRYQDEQSMDDFIVRLRQTIDTVTDQAVHVIGWSLGGLLGQQLSLQFPDSIKSLQLIASSASFVQRANWPHAMRQQVLTDFADMLMQDYRITLNRFLALQVRGSEQQQQGLRELKAKLFSRGEPNPLALREGLSLLQQVDLRQAISALAIPVMLLGGERDTLVPAAALLAMAQQIKQSKLHIIKGAGHAPFLSHPDAVLKLSRAFLVNE